jgi:hypothetical protein
LDLSFCVGREPRTTATKKYFDRSNLSVFEMKIFNIPQKLFIGCDHMHKRHGFFSKINNFYKLEILNVLCLWPAFGFEGRNVNMIIRSGTCECKTIIKLCGNLAPILLNEASEE